MVRNKLSYVLPENYKGLFKHYLASRAASEPSENISIIGGIWDCNNKGQSENPIFTGNHSIPDFWGFSMIFYKVNDLNISDLTVKDPPHDDLVALNADEGSCGPITNIEVDGIFSEGCHSAVRLLNVRQEFENIHISNIFGTYFQYCIGITKNTINGKIEGFYDSISINNIYVSKAIPVCQYPWQGDWQFPLIYIDCELHVKTLKISSFHRREENIPKETIGIFGAGTVVENMILEDISVENHTGTEFPFIKNHRTIKNLTMRDVIPGGDVVNVDDGKAENTNLN